MLNWVILHFESSYDSNINPGRPRIDNFNNQDVVNTFQNMHYRYWKPQNRFEIGWNILTCQINDRKREH